MEGTQTCTSCNAELPETREDGTDNFCNDCKRCRTCCEFAPRQECDYWYVVVDDLSAI